MQGANLEDQRSAHHEAHEALEYANGSSKNRKAFAHAALTVNPQSSFKVPSRILEWKQNHCLAEPSGERPVQGRP
jgi:hypothetical protein